MYIANTLREWLHSGTKVWQVGLLLSCVCSVCLTASLHAGKRHALAHETDAPGMLAQQTRLRGGPVPGYFQGIEVRTPGDTLISWAEGLGFDAGEPSPRGVGMQVARIYRFKLSNLPLHEAESLYPTLELIDRTYPPAALAARFPVLVQITEDDIRQALGGNMIAKVIYVEAPNRAFASQEAAGEQRWIDVTPEESALQVAKELGRPIAILRMGGVTPAPEGPDEAFLFGAPPICMLEEVGQEPPGDCQYNLAEDCQATCACERPAPGHRCLPGGPRPFPGDEYLCDGGDEDPEVKPLKDGSLRGLDAEDTVALYDAEAALNQPTRVVASNRVCIYAPRFVAVRKVVGAMLTHKNDGPVPLRGQDLANVGQGLGVPVIQKIRDPIVQQESRGRANVFQGQVFDGVESSVRALLVAQEFKTPYAHSTLARTGMFEQQEAALVEEGVLNAIRWTHSTGVNIMLGESHPSEVVGDQRAQATYVYDRLGRPELRVCKLASQSSAKPGETIEFTLRFDNLSDKPAEQITIVDNLTTRLEYVPDSQTCSVKAKFSHVENRGGSLQLSWELDEPLPGGEGGLILFKCIVR